MEDTSIQLHGMHTGMCHWTERGAFASLFDQCHQPMSYMYTGTLRDRARQDEMTRNKQSTGNQKKGGPSQRPLSKNLHTERKYLGMT